MAARGDDASMLLCRAFFCLRLFSWHANLLLFVQTLEYVRVVVFRCSIVGTLFVEPQQANVAASRLFPGVFGPANTVLQGASNSEGTMALSIARSGNAVVVVSRATQLLALHLQARGRATD